MKRTRAIGKAANGMVLAPIPSLMVINMSGDGGRVAGTAHAKKPFRTATLIKVNTRKVCGKGRVI